MVVEHAFVTTMAAPESMSAAAHFLQEFGFVAEGERAFTIGGEWTVLEVRRGVVRRGKRRLIREWPQQVRLEWDRGRVEVATSAVPPASRNFDSRGASIRKRETPHVQDLLLSLARALELLLATGQRDQAHAELAAAEQRLEKIANRESRRSRILLIIALAAVFIFFGLMIWIASRD